MRNSGFASNCRPRRREPVGQREAQLERLKSRRCTLAHFRGVFRPGNDRLREIVLRDRAEALAHVVRGMEV
jgi:hypothetical protein